MFPKAVFAPVGQVSGPVAPEGPGCRPNVFLFDLDALVPSPFGRVNEGFASYLKGFAGLAPCYLMTSANYNDVLSRLTESVRHAFAGIFAAAGTELWNKDEVQVRHDHNFSDDLYEFIVKVVQASPYPHKLALMLDCGASTLRVQLAGTRSTWRQRDAYAAWESEHRELPAVMNEFRVRFPGHRIHRDSETSLLIIPEGFSTALVRNHISERHKTAHLIAYLSPRAAETYAQPLCEAMLGKDVLSVVAGPSDVSQLLSYEKRRLTGTDPMPTVKLRTTVEA
jgi:hypothetical protein